MGLEPSMPPRDRSQASVPYAIHARLLSEDVTEQKKHMHYSPTWFVVPGRGRSSRDAVTPRTLLIGWIVQRG